MVLLTIVLVGGGCGGGEINEQDEASLAAGKAAGVNERCGRVSNSCVTFTNYYACMEAYGCTSPCDTAHGTCSTYSNQAECLAAMCKK